MSEETILALAEAAPGAGAACGGLLLLALIIWLVRRRGEDVTGAARSLGFEIRKGVRRVEVLEGFRLLERGRSPSCAYVLAGKLLARDVFLFDFGFELGEEGKSYRQSQTAAAFKVRSRPVPRFQLIPSDLEDKVKPGEGFGAVPFRKRPAFSRSYLLRGDDEAAIRDLFQPKVVSFFESRRGWCVEGGAGEWILLYREGQHVKPKDLGAFLEDAHTAFSAFVN